MEVSFQAAWEQILLHPGVCAMYLPKSEQILGGGKSTKRPQHSIYPVSGTTSWQSGKKRVHKSIAKRACVGVHKYGPSLPLNGNKKIANVIFWHISCLVIGLISSPTPITFYQLTSFCFMKAW